MAKDYREVAKVTALYYYPIKSCRGISVNEAECSESGIKHDRQWVILDRGGRVANVSIRPELALVVPTMQENSMKVEAPGMEPLILPLNMDGTERTYVEVTYRGLEGSAVHVSNQADEWFSKYLGKPYSLVMHDSSCKPRFLHKHAKYGSLPLVKVTDKVAFAEGCPLLLESSESLDVLNRRCTKFQCEMERFRPNIVISGAEAFAEDSWRSIKIGNALFRCVKKCGRCLVPNVNPFTAEKDKEEPLKTLKEFRQVPAEEAGIYGSAPILGCHLGTECSGTIKVGDTVAAN